ncbi:Alpha-tocopherol transfer protein [Dissostichus eleginoides]|uniref:Alpha-tocopherol transfer protein n=1 Tax=Dissostichus eleginoides TaxID=100907 RepID=A0AAD9CF43_DISEL|nr:Alpha-tocopherol transfer protein [Dissostichus eleginoides]
MLTSLHQDYDELAENHTRAEAQLRAQHGDQENRQRRKHLTVDGFPEGVEGKDAVVFLEEWLPSILDLPDTPEIERAHCTLRRKPQESGMPRAFVIKFLRYRDTVRILEAARKKREHAYVRQLQNNVVSRPISHTA